MNARTALPLALLGIVVAVGALRAQETKPKNGDQDTKSRNGDADTKSKNGDQDTKSKNGDADAKSKKTDTGNAADVTPINVEPPGMVSSWITYTQPDCCGPIGANGPIFWELYARTGPSLPVWGGVLPDLLNTGWHIQGGGRSLFFTPDLKCAWTVDLSISHTYFQAGPASIIQMGVFLEGGPAPNIFSPEPLDRFLILPISVRSLQQTLVNLGVGKEWYLLGDAYSDGWRWRFGFDGGGSWGSCKAMFGEIRHLTDTVWGPFAAFHTDLEVPCCANCSFIAGFRLEGNYLRNDVLRSMNGPDLGTLNFLGTLGVRF